MRPQFLVVFLTLLAGATCDILPDSMVVHEKRDTTIKHQWVRRSRIEEHRLIPVHIGLTQSNTDNGHGHALLMDISDPASPNYGRHYSQDEIADLFAPPKESMEAIRLWLETSGIERSRIYSLKHKQLIAFNARASELEMLLHATYYEYEHSEHGKITIACERYHVPKKVQPYIDFITPGIALVSRSSKRSIAPVNTRLSNLEAKSKRGMSKHKSKGRRLAISPEKLVQLSAADQCSFAVTPDCVKHLYNVTEDIKNPIDGNDIGIFETRSEIYSMKDLDRYFRSILGHKVPQGTRPQNFSVDGAPPPTTRRTIDRSEADLDVQLVYSLVYPINISYFQVDDHHYEEKIKAFPAGFFNTFLDAIDGSYCNYTAFGITGDSPKIDAVYPDKNKDGYHHKEQCGAYKPSKVFTISWGEDEDALPLRYQLRQCNEWMKLGLQGTTVVFASGDSGVGQNDNCAHGKPFNIPAPQGCPYVTTVGATSLRAGASSKPGSEHATTSFASGGGFSNIFTQPHYQKHAVQTFLSKHAPPYKSYKTKNETSPSPANGGRYNRHGRATPDVAAIGQNIPIWLFDQPALTDGTSASAPIFASLIARINNHRMKAGKSSVGFINPALYANTHMFNDILKGKNPGCGTDGFSCAPGWDPVTGLGSPDYGKMKEVFMGLP